MLIKFVACTRRSEVEPWILDGLLRPADDIHDALSSRCRTG